MNWKYYDFRNNWIQFIEQWKKPRIKYLLNYELKTIFGENHADKLWKFSSYDDLYKIAENLALQEIKDKNLIKYFEKSMANTGIKFKDESHLNKMFLKTCLGDLIETYLPKPDTIEYFMMLSIPNVVIETCYEVAKSLFPNNCVIISDNIILILDQKIIFDIFKYYLEAEIDQDYYNKLCEEFYEDLELSDLSIEL